MMQFFPKCLGRRLAAAAIAADGSTSSVGYSCSIVVVYVGRGITHVVYLVL